MRPLRQATPAASPSRPGLPGGRCSRDLAQDLRYAVGMLRRQPASRPRAILTLALGIGANSAIFALVDATLLRPLPLPDPERLVMISERTAASSRERVSPLNLLDWNERGRSFETIAGFMPGVGGMVMAGADGTAETVSRQWVTAGVLRRPWRHARRGPLPSSSRTTAQRANVVGAERVVLADAVQRGPGVVGRDIRLDGAPYTVVGVVPIRCSCSAGRTSGP